MIHVAMLACVGKAESLIEKGDDDSLRYACLELRMAIEHLFYDLIPSYANEVPTDIINRWQPQKVIEALTDCDPHIEGGGSFAIADQQGNPLAAFEYKGVTKQLIKAHWHKLGSYLHASMAGNATDWEKAVPFLTKTIEALREYRNERVLVNFGRFLAFDCTCGRTIKRNVEALKVKPRIVCPDTECGQIWKASDDDYKQVSVAMTWYTCGKCEAVNDIEERQRAEGQVLTCEKCGAVFNVRSELVLVPVER